MTDAEQLVGYRIEQAEESLASAEVLLKNGMSPRSVTNRAYYAAFYAVLALFNAKGIRVRTSKHIGVISLFDVEFVRTGKIEKEHSIALHKLFDKRLEFDYKDHAAPTEASAVENIRIAGEFVARIKTLIAEP